MFGSLKPYSSVPASLLLITFPFLLPASLTEANNSGIMDYSSLQSDTSNIDRDSSSFIFISFAGRKYFREARKSEYIIETCRLPVSVYYDLKKATARPAKDKTSNGKQISRILYPYQEEMKTYGIKDKEKFKQFYPRGLQPGDFISEQEFDNWNFTEPFYVASKIWVVKAKPDSMEMISYYDSIRDSNRSRLNRNPLPILQPEVCYFPWKKDYIAPYRNPVLTNMDLYVTGLMKELARYSPCLGAQRIRLELYDNPMLATFYSEMYLHYVDSIYHVLKDSLNIKPGESERFIQEISSIIPCRFKYASNYFLWEGISKNKLDCDNTAYLVFDIGYKLGMEVSIVVLRSHVIALVGDFAYETTGSSYYSKDDLAKEYADIFLITSNRDSINALAAIYEISNFLAVNGEYVKAKAFVTEGLRYFPDDPQLLKTMGDVCNFMENYEDAFQCYYRANQKLPNDLYICMNLNMTKNHLILTGKNDLVLDIIKK